MEVANQLINIKDHLRSFEVINDATRPAIMSRLEFLISKATHF